jgi:hypothetical protein
LVIRYSMLPIADNLKFDKDRAWKKRRLQCSRFVRRGNFLVSEHRLKKLWERFVTAINSVQLPSNIVVKNHSH